MTGLFDAVLGPDVAGAESSALLRSIRRHGTTFTIDTDTEVGLVLSLSENHRVERRMGGRIHDDAPRVGSITLLPPGCAASFSIEGCSSVLMLRLPWRTVTGLLAEDHDLDPARIELQPRLHATDDVLARLLYQLASNSVSLGLEASARAIAARLLAGHSTMSRPEWRDRRLGGIPKVRLKRVLDRIESDLACPLALGTLASEAGMSPYHFAREFQRATGTSPHRYVVRRRIDRAVMMLAKPGATIAEIASSAGFSHATHLSRHMRRLTGLSPEAFRIRVLPENSKNVL